jgi:glucose/arabinose dehydrogenase
MFGCINRFFFLATVFLSVILASESMGQNITVKDLPPNTKIEKLIDGLDVIWGLELLSEDDALIALKSGKMFYLNFTKKVRLQLDGVPQVSTSGQAGLLDVRLSPDFKKDKQIFFTYSKKTDTGDTTALACAQWELGEAKLKSVRDLFVGKTDNSGSVHFGSRIAFDKAGHIFFGIGDRGERQGAQELNWHNGKIIRLKLDGSVPSDNPFVGVKNALPEIYSLGHRNPQGLFYSVREQKLYNSEHGPRGGDEINEVKRGLNYGWPVITYGREYYGPKIGDGPAKPGMEQPFKVYVPSIAPSSLIKYESGKIKAFTNSFILGALVLEHLNVVSADGKVENRYLQSMSKRIRQVKESPAGHLLFTTDSGEIYRISPL